jgi:hypothetical protein
MGWRSLNNEMPPADLERKQPAGITDDAERAELIRLAHTFVKEADAAVGFESSRNAATPEFKNP